MKEYSEGQEHSTLPPATAAVAVHDAPPSSSSSTTTTGTEGSSSKEQVEAVLTVPGSMEDRQFPQQLSNLQGNLRNILRIGENQIHVRRVEPWNSVRITFVLPPTAATRLQALAAQADNQLAGMGVLTVRVGEANPVTVQLVPSTSGAPQEPPAKKPKSDKKGRPRKTPTAKLLPPPLPAPPLDAPPAINGDTSALAVLQHVLSSIATHRGGSSSSNDCQPSTSKVDLQPNVVATTSQPIPIPTTPVMGHAAATGPFPFASMTKVAYTLKNTMTSSAAGASTLTTTAAARETPGRSAGTAKAASPTKAAHQRNIALTSPLLVNLLQSSEASGASTSAAAPATPPAAPSQPAKRTKKKKLAELEPPIPPPLEVDKKPSRPRKRKKVEATNGIEEMAAIPASPGAAGGVLLLNKDHRTIAPKSLSESSMDVPTSTAPTFITVFALTSPGLTRTSSSPLVWSAPAAVTSTASTTAVALTGNVLPVAVVPVRAGTPLARSPAGAGEVRSPSPAAAVPSGRRTPKAMPSPLLPHPLGPHQPTVANGESSTSSLDSGISLGLTGSLEEKPDRNGRHPGVPGAAGGVLLLNKDHRTIAPKSLSESSMDVPTSTAPTFITVFALTSPGLTRTSSSPLVWSAPAAVTSTASTTAVALTGNVLPVAVVPVRAGTPLARSPAGAGEVRSPSPAAAVPTGRRTPKAMPSPLLPHPLGPHQPTVANGESSTSSLDSGISLGLTGSLEEKPDRNSINYLVAGPAPAAAAPSIAQSKTTKAESFTVINTAVAANPASRLKTPPITHPANGPLKVVTLVEHKIGSCSTLPSSEVKLLPPSAAAPSAQEVLKKLPPPVTPAPPPPTAADLISVGAPSPPAVVANHVDAVPMEAAS
ncbi:mucin-5AC-like [Paramacrobiotus metropolitanus]|uniref:mucin-5AC-like n=1 Tax=Paramacrobiotus metropolitanus TaxID=2943436 RepID=UPI0024460E23|nr:mucin-5AC-like [Paramacrobiotus metropolitanus]